MQLLIFYYKLSAHELDEGEYKYPINYLQE